MSEIAEVFNKDCVIITNTDTQITRVLWGNLAIVVITPTSISINARGETTTSMRNKIHNAARKLGLPFCIFNSRGVWWIGTPFNGALLYCDNITFSRVPLTDNDPAQAPDSQAVGFVFEKNTVITADPAAKTVILSWNCVDVVAVSTDTITITPPIPINATTRFYINRFSGKLHLRFRVGYSKGVWSVDTPDNQILELSSGLTFLRDQTETIQEIIDRIIFERLHINS